MLFLFVLSGRVLNTCLLPKEVREFAEEVDMIEKINLKNFQSHLNQKTRQRPRYDIATAWRYLTKEATIK